LTAPVPPLATLMVKRTLGVRFTISVRSGRRPRPPELLDACRSSTEPRRAPGATPAHELARIFRFAQADRALTDAAAASLSLWEDWEARAGRPLLQRGERSSPAT
jgi:hypothetical protein